MSAPPSTNSYQIVRETWLTRKPNPSAFTVAATATLALALGSLAFLSGAWGLDELMPASFESAIQHRELWRLWTTLFAHGDLGHLVSNTLLFFILGYFLNGYFGAMVFPALAFVFGGITNLVVLPTYGDEMDLIGASGVVYWMGGVWLVLYFFLSRQKNFTQRWLRSLGVAVLIFMPSQTFEPRVSYRTHFVGFVLGVAFGICYFWFHREKFRAAEVREWIVDDDDPEDDLPGPEGFT